MLEVIIVARVAGKSPRNPPISVSRAKIWSVDYEDAHAYANCSNFYLHTQELRSSDSLLKALEKNTSF